MNNIVSLEGISKSFRQGGEELAILQEASLAINAGEIVALVGPSGSGKSTLLQIAGLLDKTDSGIVTINGQDCTHASDQERTKLRRESLGFVYQFHHLLPEFSAIENVMLPLMIAGVAKKTARERAMAMLEKVGLKDRVLHRPAELSGGEQQRTAIARALVGQPTLLLADEPTGNLDPHTAAAIFALLLECVHTLQLAALIVTHNHELARQMHRVVAISEGKLVEA